MSQTQLNRFAVISKVIDGSLTLAEAAVGLGISQRQVIRLKKGVLAQGAEALIHKNTNRKPAHSFPQSIVDKIRECKKFCVNGNNIHKGDDHLCKTYKHNLLKNWPKNVGLLRTFTVN